MMSFMYRLIVTSNARLHSKFKTQRVDVSGDVVQIRGIIFDMDGTLTEPVLDFKEIRRQLQIPQGADILHYIDSLTCQSERNELHSKLEEFEARAAGQLTLQQGLRELLLFSSEKGVKRALVTRNSQDGIAAFLKKLGSLTSCNEIFTHVMYK